MLTEKAKQQEEMLVEYDESEAQQKDLESEVDLLRAQVDSMKDELRVSILMCEQPELMMWSMVYLLFQLTSLVFVEGTPVGPCDDFAPLSWLIIIFCLILLTSKLNLCQTKHKISEIPNWYFL